MTEHPGIASRTTSIDAGPVIVRGDMWGDADSPRSAVLLHGGGQTRHSWRRTGTRLARAGWTVLAVDTRGHGDSDWSPDGDYSSDALIGDLTAVLTTLTSPPVLIGASLGGLTSILTEGESAGLARALVLVDVTLHVEPDGARRVMDFLAAHAEGFANLDEAADAVATYNPSRPRPASSAGLLKNLRQRSGRYYWHWDPRFLGDPPVRRTDEARVTAAAARIKTPVLVVRGGASDVVSTETLTHLKEVMPQTQVLNAEGGHMIVGDDNDTFATGLMAFLASV